VKSVKLPSQKKREVEEERELRKGEHGTEFYLLHCLFKPT